MTTIVEADVYRDGGSLSLTLEKDGIYYKLWMEYDYDSNDYQRPVMLRGRARSEEMFELTWGEVKSLIEETPIDFTRSPMYTFTHDHLGETYGQKDLDECLSYANRCLGHIQELVASKTAL